MNNKILKILFIGDIVGKPGRRAVQALVPQLREELGIDLVFANGENLAAGKGMTVAKYEETKSFGIDYFTSGNHIWNNEDIVGYLDDPKIKVLRPANYIDRPGRGFVELLVAGKKIVLVNVQGRVFIDESLEDPFVTAKNIVDLCKDAIIIVDIHAEATSEKAALGYYLDGLVTAVLGTHTHVQTADEKILPKGTAFITDIGMVGPEESVLGVKKEIIIEKFLTALPLSHKVATGDSIFNAVLLEVDTQSNKALKIERINKIYRADSAQERR